MRLGLGRATTHQVTQRWLKGQMFARNPFAAMENPGTCFGSRIRRDSVMVSNPAMSKRLRTSEAPTQFVIGFRGLAPTQLRHPDERPPGAAVGVDDNSRVGAAVGSNSIEEGDKVVCVRDEVGKDDHVECLAEVELFTRAVHESKLGISPSGGVDHSVAQIDADAAGRPQCGKQITGSAADFQHRLARGNMKAIHVLDKLVVTAVPAAPPVRLRREAIEVPRDRSVMPCAGVLGRGGHGGKW